MIRFLITLLLLIVQAPAWAAGESGRRSAFYGLVGLGATQAALVGENGGGKSTYKGWGFDLEPGMDLNFDKEFGLNLAGIAQYSDFTNSSSGQKFFETGKFQAVGAKLGLYIGPITVGAGMRKTELNAQSLDLTSGYVKNELKGDEKFGFVSLTFNNNGKYRSVAEFNYVTGTLGALKTTQFNLFFRFGIVDFFGR